MAELSEGGDVHSGRSKKRGGVRAKKASTRIDMTPMVDLGFLLVTFFILTTTLQQPNAMPVKMPDVNQIDKNPKRASEVLTIILGPNDKIYYYDSIANFNIEVTNFSKIRNILINKNKQVKALQAQKKWEPIGVVVQLKATDDAKYENLVNLLDELSISRINPPAIVDLTEDEKRMLPGGTPQAMLN